MYYSPEINIIIIIIIFNILCTIKVFPLQVQRCQVCEVLTCEGVGLHTTVAPGQCQNLLYAEEGSTY